VAQVLANIARQRGLLFYADDLHWADRGTLWLLGHLLRQLRNERALIVGCYRETELDRTHSLARSLLDWNRERLVTRIAVRRFDAAETSAQLSALLGEDVSADFGQAVHRETEGNPFFIEEVLKALIEQGSVKRESGRWKRCDVGELMIPQSVKEAIGNRLDRISEESNEVLRVAAVLGKTFSFDALQAAADKIGEDALLDALDESVTAQLITATSNDSFTFTHDKIREVLYEELNPIRRRRLHRHAAEGLVRRGGTSMAVERLAYHYIQAGDYENGLIYAKRAAAEAEKVFAIDEVIAAYNRARDCAESLKLTDEQLALEEAMGKAYLLHGDLIPAGEHFERAMRLTTDASVRARLQTEAASSLVATGDQRGVEYLHEALQVLDPVQNPLETAAALSNEARFHHLAGRHSKAIELLNRAATLIEPFAAAETVSTFAAPIISQIYGYLAGAYQHYGLYRDSNGWARRAIEFGEAHNVAFARAMGYEFLGENAIHKGTFDEGLSYAEEERKIVEKIHSRERRCWTHFVAAMCAFHKGDYARSAEEYTEGIALSEAIGERRVTALLKGNYGVLQAEQAARLPDDSEDRKKLLAEALATALENFREGEAAGLLYSRFESHRCLAYVRFRRGELAEAEAVCAAIAAIIAPTESRVSRLWLGPLYVDILMASARELQEQQPKEAEAKLALARDLLAPYQKLVAECHSPRFQAEAVRMANELMER
jgi:tetratricopeptide (TPR) repeat protein